MALSYPEGEVFFKTKDLQVKSSNPDDWKASVPGDFYGYFLLEYQGNCAVDWGSGGNLPPMKSHPRSDYVREKASNYSTTFAWWHHVGVSIGKHDDIKRRFNIHMNPNVNAYKDRDRGGPKIVRYSVRSFLSRLTSIRSGCIHAQCQAHMRSGCGSMYVRMTGKIDDLL